MRYALNSLRAHYLNYATYFDYAFIFFLIFSCVLGSKSTIPLLIFGIMPIVFCHPNNITNLYKKLPISPGMYVIAYFSHCITYLAFYPGIPANIDTPPNPSWELYLVAILMLLVGFVRGAQINELSRRFRRAVTPSLYVSFAVLTVYAILDVTGDGRVQAEASWPFVPALLFSTWTFLSLIGWPTLSPAERYLRLGLVSLSLVVVHGYTGSRGIGVAHTATLFLLFASYFSPRLRNRLPSPTQLASSIVLGLALFGIHQALTSNNALLRLRHVPDLLLQTESLVSPSNAFAEDHNQVSSNSSLPIVATQYPMRTAIEFTSGDASTNIRIQMWEMSMQEIFKAPIVGHGALSMKTLIYDRFKLPHNHNQFLSWLLTGGIILFTIGVHFTLTTFLCSRTMEFQDRFSILLGTTVLWNVSMLFDSFLSMKFFLHYYCIVVGFIAALAAQHSKKMTLSIRPQDKMRLRDSG